MASTPHVSVIIPTYNRAGLLVEAIESVLAQSFQNYELIVADDGSSDDTTARVAAFGDRVRYLPLRRSGRTEVTRNAALQVARGDLVAFLDDDDLWREDKLALQVAALTGGAAGFSYTDVVFLEPDGTTSTPRLHAHQKRSDAVFDHLLSGCFVHPSTVVMEKALADRLGRFDEGLSSQGDYDLWLRAAHASTVVCVAQPLVQVRRYTAGLSLQREALHYENAIRIVARLQQTHSLTRRQRRRARITLSRWHAHLGIRLLNTDPPGAQRHLLRSLRYNPLQRAAWVALAAALRPA